MKFVDPLPVPEDEPMEAVELIEDLPEEAIAEAAPEKAAETVEAPAAEPEPAAEPAKKPATRKPAAPKEEAIELFEEPTLF